MANRRYFDHLSAFALRSIGAAALAAACGTSFSGDDCRETRTCKTTGDEGGSAGIDGDGGDGSLDAPSSSGGAAGDDASVGAGAGAGAAGAAGASSNPTPECPEGYAAWFTSAFAFPDGEVLGTADFPSFPWVGIGNLAIDEGRLEGVGTAIISQGTSFPYDGSRVRYRVRFTDSAQAVSVAINSAADGVGGLRATLDAVGELIITEGQASRGQIALEPLETGLDWFVELVVLSGGDARASVASGNYPGATGSTSKAELQITGLKSTATGKKTAVRLDSQAGIAPAVDELSVARCGVEPPQYEAKLVDTFERPDSTTIGHAELPTSATWLDPSATFRIVDGALQSNGQLKVASIPLAELPLTGLRIRTSIRAVTGGNAPYLWADVNFNVAQGIRGISNNGFWVWGGPTESHFYTGIFPGGGSLEHEAVPDTAVYFAQLDRDGDAAVLTVREHSFDGPILGVQFADALTATPDPGGYLTVGDEGGQGTRWEEIRVDVFYAN